MTRSHTPLDKIRIRAYLRRADAHGFCKTRLVTFFHDMHISPKRAKRICKA